MSTVTKSISMIASAVILLASLTGAPISAQQVALVGGMLLDGYEAPPIHTMCLGHGEYSEWFPW